MIGSVPAREPQLADKVRFLGDSANLGEPGAAVERIETHFAWVFLTSRHVWKLRKPMRYRGLDTLSANARHLRCDEELKLNQALAPGIYLDVVSLVQEPGGGLRLGGPGPVVDWVLRMRRLPAARMFDRMIREGTWQPADLEALMSHLCAFYSSSPVAQMSGPAYCRRLHAIIEENRKALLAVTSHGIAAAKVLELTRLQEQLLDTHRALLTSRSEQGAIRDCHGDLKPEHICVGPPVSVIDRLEFDPALRRLDPIEDLCFLKLECARGGSQQAGEWLLQKYLAQSALAVPSSLVHFYLSNRALVRAKLSAWRLAEPDADRAQCQARIRDYMARALVAASVQL